MVAGTASNGLPDRRINASSVPKKMPPRVAMKVSCRLNSRPFNTKPRKISALKKPKSKACMSVLPDAEHAGHEYQGHRGTGFAGPRVAPP
jgi:hypothetical protein